MTPKQPRIDRRIVLKTLAAAGSTSIISAPASAQQEERFVVEQHNQCYEVEPLAVQKVNIKEFYDYRSFSAHTSTALETSDISFLFLYEDPNGDVSLVALHDKQVDSTGGAVTFTYRNLPKGNWLVKDDPEFGGNDEGYWTSNPTVIEWGWGSKNTDGGAYGPLGSSFDVTIEPAFNEDASTDPFDEIDGVEYDPETMRIREWCFLSGDAEDPNSIHLDMNCAVRIHNGEASCETAQTPDHECLLNPEMDIKPCSDPNAINSNSKGLIPVGLKGTDHFDPASEVVVSSLRFGAPEVIDAGNGATAAHDGHREDIVPCEGDGIEDLVVHFPTEDTGFEQNDSQGKLVGETTDGFEFVVYDSVKIVGGKGGGKGP